MTRFAGDGKVLKLRGQMSGRVVNMEAHRVRSQAETAAQKRREDGLAAWFRESSAATFSTSDYVQLHGFVPHLTQAELVDFAAEAVGHLLLAHRCPDGDPAKGRNFELFYSCIADAVAADAEAVGR